MGPTDAISGIPFSKPRSCVKSPLCAILPVAERHPDDVAAVRHARHGDAPRVDDAGLGDDVPGRGDLVPHLRLPEALLQRAHQALCQGGERLFR